MPLWLWFIVPNLISFHPSEWNNTKFFLFWQLAGCILIASWLSTAFSAVSQRWSATRRYVGQLAAVVCVLLMISAGGLDTVRAMQRSTAIPWVQHDDVAAAMWLRKRTRTSDVIVYGTSNTSAAAALGGRRAVSGYTGWTYDLGVRDWAERWSATGTILRGGPEVGAAIKRYGADLVVIGPGERRSFAASDDYWSQAGTLVFSAGEYRISTRRLTLIRRCRQRLVVRNRATPATTSSAIPSSSAAMPSSVGVDVSVPVTGKGAARLIVVVVTTIVVDVVLGALAPEFASIVGVCVAVAVLTGVAVAVAVGVSVGHVPPGVGVFAPEIVLDCQLRDPVGVFGIRAVVLAHPAGGTAVYGDRRGEDEALALPS